MLWKNYYFYLSFQVWCFQLAKKDPVATDNGLNPTSTQNGFAVNYTATWCFYCGDWGELLTHDYANAAPNGAIVASHAASDPMTNNLYASFTADRTTGGGIPSFWVGDVMTTSAGAMTALLSQAAPCGVDYKYSVSGSTMTIDTKTKFFSAATGDYYLSVLIVEDGINGNSTAGNYAQNGVTNSYPNDDFKHDFVLRASNVAGNAYGVLITQNPAADFTIDKSFTIALEPTWKNPYAECIIWKHESSGAVPKYKYMNSLRKKM